MSDRLHSVLLQRVLAYRYAVLAVLGATMVTAAAFDVSPDNDWFFFAWGSDILLGHDRPFVRSAYTIDGDRPGGLHIYANYPFLQIGPPALLLAIPLSLPPDQGLLLAAIVVQALGLLTVMALERAYRFHGQRDRVQLKILLGGGLVTVVWGALTQFRHLDDALTLTGAVLAVLALRRGSPGWAGLCLGVAAASKPWGVPLLALALAPPDWRRRLRCAGVAAAATAVWWLPFVIADRRTFLLGKVGLFQSPDSTLQLIDLDSLLTAQHLRFVQIGVGLLVVVFVVQLGAWHLAPLAAFSWRLLIDPSTYSYYGAAVVAAALLADLATDRLRLPVFTLVAASGWVAAEATAGAASGWVRLVTYGGLVICTTGAAVRSRGPRVSRQRFVPAPGHGS